MYSREWPGLFSFRSAGRPEQCDHQAGRKSLAAKDLGTPRPASPPSTSIYIYVQPLDFFHFCKMGAAALDPLPILMSWRGEAWSSRWPHKPEIAGSSPAATTLNRQATKRQPPPRSGRCTDERRHPRSRQPGVPGRVHQKRYIQGHRPGVCEAGGRAMEKGMQQATPEHGPETQAPAEGACGLTPHLYRQNPTLR
jgi:hypothetical protein